tara:strand:+ start:946 stop:1263 length:318 start_codon:yes stop_codon:yes gene_type:complete
MDIAYFENYSIINCNNLDSFNLLITFLKKQTTNYPNVIINMLNFQIDEDMVVSNLLPFYLNWEKRNKSFILVSNFRKTSTVDIISIQTLEEAIDFFHMEDLTRNI